MNGISPEMVSSSFGLIHPEAPLPDNAHVPGTVIYLIVTPGSHNNYTHTWRPKPYFILSTKVARARVLLDTVLYDLADTHYQAALSRMHTDERIARKELKRIFREETGGTITLSAICVLPALEERKAWEAHMEKLSAERSIIPIVQES